MGSIYNGAEVTIVAVAGRDPSYGLPGVRSARRLATSFSFGLLNMTNVDWDTRRAIETSKWASRGWTLQEELLSRRCLYFTEREVVFSCKTGLIYEKTWLPTSSRGTRWPEGYFNATPQTVLQAYSRRRLRCEEDTLHAISGVLDWITGDQLRLSHLWGVVFELPSCQKIDKGFDIGLRWHSLKRGRRKPGFPSWSSLGWHAEVYYSQRLGLDCLLEVWIDDSYRIFNSLTPVQLKVLREQPTHTSQCLQITAPTFRVPVEYWEEVPACLIELEDVEFWFQPMWDAAPSSQDILCTILQESRSVLLLQPKDDVDGVFERVGLFEVFSVCWFHLRAKPDWSLSVEQMRDLWQDLMRYRDGRIPMEMTTFILA